MRKVKYFEALFPPVTIKARATDKNVRELYLDPDAAGVVIVQKILELEDIASGVKEVRFNLHNAALYHIDFEKLN